MNLSSKTILSIAAAAIIGVTALGFIAVTRSRRVVPVETLSGEVGKLIATWDVAKTPRRRRVINIVLGDVRGAQSPLSVSDHSPSGGFGERLGRLFRRRVPPTASPETELARGLSRKPGVVTWTFDGFSTADEKEAVKDLALGIIKAHDAGAEINVVAQGDVGAFAMKAVKSLEGQVRSGVPVGANKVVLLGVNSKRLEVLDPVFFRGFKRPSNVFEWSNVYTDKRTVPEAPAIEFYDDRHEGAAFPGSVWLGPSADVSDQRLSEMLCDLFDMAVTMAVVMHILEAESLRSKVAAAAAAAVEPETPAARDYRSVDDGRIRTAPEDSTAMVKRDPAVAAAMKAAEERVAAAARVRPGPSPDSTAAPAEGGVSPEASEKGCAKCCADLGGTWIHQNDTGRWGTYRGCCQGVQYDGKVPSCLAAFRDGSDFDANLRFTCNKSRDADAYLQNKDKPR